MANQLVQARVDKDIKEEASRCSGCHGAHRL